MPKKCFVTYEEITGAIEYLISHAARNVTGQVINIDGGWTCQ
jgi:3-hydroxybutyrate dehydrogenase